MNILTRSSIELVSPSVTSGTSCPTMRYFYIFGNLFYGFPHRRKPTAYKLSKSYFNSTANKERSQINSLPSVPARKGEVVHLYIRGHE